MGNRPDAFSSRGGNSIQEKMLKRTLLSLLLPLALGKPVEGDQSQKRYAIMDNDWGNAGFVPFLLALNGGMELLALVSGKFQWMTRV